MIDTPDEFGHDSAPQGMWEPPAGYEAPETGTDFGVDDPHEGDYATGGYGGESGDGDTVQGVDGETPSTDDSGPTEMTVEINGESRTVTADHDYTGDGQNDAAVETQDGRVIVFADTENNETGEAGPDGKADEAYIIDKETGQVVGAAHVDPSTGEWVDGVDQDGPSATGESGSGGGATTSPDASDTGTGTGSSDDGDVDGRRDAPDDTTTTEPTGDTTTTGGEDTVITAEVGGHEVGVTATVDTNDDGKADSGVIYVDGKAVILTSTDDDPDAEQATVVDAETGQVITVAHVDPSTGEWEEGPAEGSETGSTDTGSTDTGSTGTSDTSGSGDEGTGSDGTEGTPVGDSGTSTGSGGMSVEVNGQTQDIPADKDYTGDGQADAAVESPDGSKVVIFSDTENNETGAAGPDGKADEAYIVDKETGQVVGAAHVDPTTGEWVEGTDPDGTSAIPAGQGSQGS